MDTVVIDPGHGGTQTIGGSSPNNATGPNGTLEKNVTLRLGIGVAEALASAGVDAILTRDTDVNLALRARAEVASNNSAKAFLSIHFNGDLDPRVQGTETWVHSTSTSDSRLLAASIQDRMVSATGYRNRGVKAKALGVLSMEYQSPATACCLAEVSFLTDPDDEERLADPTYIQSLADELSQAIIDYLNNSTSLRPAVPVVEGPQTGEVDG